MKGRIRFALRFRPPVTIGCLRLGDLNETQCNGQAICWKAPKLVGIVSLVLVLELS
jgi:hypothetical protein